MTAPEYRQDDRTEGYCPQCGEPLSALTVTGRGICEYHGWQYADYRRPSDRDPGDETDERATICPECGSGILDGEHIAAYPCSRRAHNLTPGVMTGEENDDR